VATFGERCCPPFLFGAWYEWYGRLANFHCTPPDEYFFTINDLAWKWNFDLRPNAGPKAKDMLEFKQVQQLEGDYAVERNKYVPPGPRGPR
jgi:hypothetical protein